MQEDYIDVIKNQGDISYRFIIRWHEITDTLSNNVNLDKNNIVIEVLMPQDYNEFMKAYKKYYVKDAKFIRFLLSDIKEYGISMSSLGFKPPNGTSMHDYVVSHIIKGDRTIIDRLAEVIENKLQEIAYARNNGSFRTESPITFSVKIEVISDVPVYSLFISLPLKGKKLKKKYLNRDSYGKEKEAST
jgi:hypothetical protein